MGTDQKRERITLNPPIDCMVIEQGGSLVAPLTATAALLTMAVSSTCFSAGDSPNGYEIINDVGSTAKVFFWLGSLPLAEAAAAPQSCGLVVVPVGMSVAVSAFGRKSGLDVKRINLQCAADETANVFVNIVNY